VGGNRPGNAGKNIVQEPGSVYFDTSLMKDFLASESKRFEFRAEFFSVVVVLVLVAAGDQEDLRGTTCMA
jgi:hypothetical protein